MRSTIVVMAAAAALGMMSATGAQAAEWCGYAAHAKSVIECGYSSNTQCEDAIGKGGMCFVDPEIAANALRFRPVVATKLFAGRS